MNSSKTNDNTLQTNNSIIDQIRCLEDSNKIKAVIFDFDGVLSSFLIRIGWPVVASAIMVKSDLTPESIAKHSIEVFTMLNNIDKKPNNSSLLKYAFNTGKSMGMSNLQAAKFIVLLVINYTRSRKKIVPVVGVRKVLREIMNEDYKLVLLTNSSHKVIKVAKEKIPELNEFDFILTRSDVDKIKPDASGFIKALELLNLQPDEVISIGDQASDLIASKKVGIKTIAMNNKEMAHAKFQLEEQNPNFIIDDIKEIPSILKFLRDCIIEDIKLTFDLTEKSLNDYILENGFKSAI